MAGNVAAILDPADSYVLHRATVNGHLVSCAIGKGVLDVQDDNLAELSAQFETWLKQDLAESVAEVDCTGQV